jgi:hypothetical protein
MVPRHRGGPLQERVTGRQSLLPKQPRLLLRWLECHPTFSLPVIAIQVLSLLTASRKHCFLSLPHYHWSGLRGKTVSTTPPTSSAATELMAPSPIPHAAVRIYSIFTEYTSLIRKRRESDAVNRGHHTQRGSRVLGREKSCLILQPREPIRFCLNQSTPRIATNTTVSTTSSSQHVWTRTRRQVQQGQTRRYAYISLILLENTTDKNFSGGKHFSRDLQPLDKNGEPIGMWRDPADKNNETSEEDSSEEESGDESSAGEGPTAAPQQELTREERRAQAKLRREAARDRKFQKPVEAGASPTSSEDEEDGDMPANPNHTQKARNQARAATGASGETPAPARKAGANDENLSRREREALAAEAAKQRYQKLHAEGKTDEARADLARLKLIREQRDAAAARKQAEKEEKDSQAAANKERLEREAKKREAAMGPSAGKKTAKGRK